MYAIYKTKGPAKEYDENGLTIYKDCENGCKYCYGPDFANKTPEQFHVSPTPRENILEKVEKDLISMQKNNDNSRTLISFMSDCYQELEEETRLTRQVIELFLKYERPFTILTKGGWRSTADFDLLKTRPDLCRYGTTLVFYKDEESRIWEPKAAPTSERITALHHAHALGIPTFVSCEPCWTFEDTRSIILTVGDFADEVWIGKLNYHDHAKEVNWKEFKTGIVDLCQRHRINYTLKNSLKYL
jgi:DNA repair photolyase